MLTYLFPQSRSPFMEKVTKQTLFLEKVDYLSAVKSLKMNQPQKHSIFCHQSCLYVSRSPLQQFLSNIVTFQINCQILLRWTQPTSDSWLKQMLLHVRQTAACLYSPFFPTSITCDKGSYQTHHRNFTQEKEEAGPPAVL